MGQLFTQKQNTVEYMHDMFHYVCCTLLEQHPLYLETLQRHFNTS